MKQVFEQQKRDESAVDIFLLEVDMPDSIFVVGLGRSVLGERVLAWGFSKLALGKVELIFFLLYKHADYKVAD